MDKAPIETVLMREWLDTGARRLARGQRFLGLYDGEQQLVAVCWCGVNIIPWGFDSAGLDLLARRLQRMPLIANSLVGTADQVLPLWERMAPYFRQPHEVREHQISMIWKGAGSEIAKSSSALISAVRPATISEYQLVFPASVAMISEELGYDPTASGSFYARRVRELVAAGRTYVQLGADSQGAARVDFKADVGAIAGGVAQLQGVYVLPELRGQGLASRAIASVAQQVSQRFGTTVHLYVNDYNLPAVRAYEKAGFEPVGEYATVMW